MERISVKIVINPMKRFFILHLPALNHTAMRKKERFPKFSDDHDENIEMQNNYLLMKIMLESDAKISSSHPQTPEMRNSFLKFVIKNKLHLTFSNKVADLLGNPIFPDEKALDHEAFKLEHKRLKNLLSSHSIKVKFEKKLNDRLKYNFITKELFEYETDKNPELPMEFFYEFFHRDFESEIREAADFFMTDFFEQELENENDYGIDVFESPKKFTVTKEKFLNQIDAVYPLFYQINQSSFSIEKVKTDTKLVKSNFEGTGFCEGNLKYSVVYPDGEKRAITGRFTIYFRLEYLGFLVSYYEIAGLNCPANSSKAKS
jgi:hypothetical protein